MAEKLSAAVVVFFRIVEFLILIRVLLTWLPIRKENVLVQFLYMVTEPILSPIRNLIARSAIGKNSMFDFSYILAYVLLGFLKNILLLLIARL